MPPRRRTLALLAALPAVALMPIVLPGTASAAADPVQLYWSTAGGTSTIYTRSAGGAVAASPYSGTKAEISPAGRSLGFLHSGAIYAADLSAPTGDGALLKGSTGSTSGFDIRDGESTSAPGEVLLDDQTSESPTTVDCTLDTTTTDDTEGTSYTLGAFKDGTGCDINPTWGTDDISGFGVASYSSDPSQQGVHEAYTDGSSAQQVRTLGTDAATSTSYRAGSLVYTLVNGATGSPYVVSTSATTNVPQPLGGPGVTFDVAAGSLVDRWHFSSDGRSVISAQSYGNVPGIWRLDPTEPTLTPQLVDGTLPASLASVSRPLPGSVIVASGLPTSLPDNFGKQSFTTSIDNTSATDDLTGASLTVEIAIPSPSDVVASDVDLRIEGNRVPLTGPSNHLHATVPLDDVTHATAQDLAMSIALPATIDGSTWRTTFSVTGAQGSAASALVGRSIVPTVVEGGYETVTTAVASPATGTASTPITLAAAVEGKDSFDPTPTGIVSFFEGATKVGDTGALDARGHASLVTTFSPGIHTVTALYQGDNDGVNRGHSRSSTTLTVTIGTAPPSASPAAPLPAPGAPTITGIAPAPGKLLALWTAPTGAHAAITGYTITCTKGGTVAASATTTKLSATLSGLTNKKDHRCTVLAHSDAGDGPASAAVTARPGDAPKVTLKGISSARKGAKLSLSGTATAAGRVLAKQSVSITFTKKGSSKGKVVSTVKTSSKGVWKVRVALSASGSYKASLVLGPTTAKSKGLTVRAV